MPHPDIVRAAVYLRISRDPLDTRRGVTRQLKDCEALAAELGWAVVDTYDENNTSATSGKRRSEYERLVADVKRRHITGVVFWEFDRFTRSPREADDMLELAKTYGLRAAHTSGGEMDLVSPTGRRNVVVAGADARKETDQLSKRLRAAFDQKALAGDPHGAVPFGWRRVRDFNDRGHVTAVRDELHPVEAEVVRTAAARLLSGESLRSVTAQLNLSGITPPRSTAWSSSQTRQMLLRARNAGQRRHRGQVVGAGTWPPIYDADTHDRVVALLSDPSRRNNKGATRKHLLTGIALCGRDECAGTMIVNVGRVAKGKRQPPAYVCATCTRVRRKQVDVDDVVTAVMIARLAQPDVLSALASGDPAEVEQLRAEVAGLEAKLDRCADDYAADLITSTQLARITAALRPKVETARATIAARLPRAGLDGMAGPDAQTRWAAAGLDTRRAVIETLCTVTIMPSGPGKPFDPQLIQIDWRAT